MINSTSLSDDTFDEYEEDAKAVAVEPIDIDKCQKAYAYIKEVDAVLALICVLSCKNKLIGEALKETIDTYHFQRCYQEERQPEVVQWMKDLILKAIIYIKKVGKHGVPF